MTVCNALVVVLITGGDSLLVSGLVGVGERRGGEKLLEAEASVLCFRCYGD